MKKIFVYLNLICLISLYSGTIQLSENGISSVRVGSKSSDGFELDINLEKLDFTPVKTEKGDFIQLSFEGAKFSQEIGSPKLPVLNELIEFPQGSVPEVAVVSFKEKEILLKDFGITSKINPAQPSYSKSAKPEDIKFVKNESAYSSDSFNQLESAVITRSGTMRGVGIGVLKVSPVRYNPVRNSLKVFTELKLRVRYNGMKSDIAEAKAYHYSPFFENQFAKTINYIPSKSKEDLTRHPITYLIIANEVLLGNAKLTEFINWKTQKGFNVITQFFNSSATTSTVDAWVEEQYNNLNPKPTFLLIIGDQSGTYVIPTEQNPALGSTGGVTVSDLMYSVIGATSDTNRIPSIYVGRFSVNNLDELNAQIDKTIWYEKNQFDTDLNPVQDFTYLSRVLGVSGVDGSYAATYGNPQIRYGMTHYFKNGYILPVDETSVNITGIPYYYPASANSSADAAVVAEVSSGVAFYNYTAHGYNGGFADPTFTIQNVNSLTNSGKYPLVVGNCCLTGSFRDTECFGESWLNAENKGGIGFIGASMSTYWDEDLAMGIGEVVTGDITPPYTPDSYGMYDGQMRMRFPTQGAVRFSGLMAVEELNTSYTSSYWSSYHLFGDPSLMVFIGIPGDNTVSHDPVVTNGITYFTVEALPGSYASLIDEEGNLHGAALADEFGYAVLTIEPFYTGNAILTVTSQFKKPYITAIPVEDLTTPYLVINNHSVSSSYFGSNGTIGIELKNIGALPSENISVTASSLSEYINFTDNQESYNNIAAGDSLMKNAVFSYSISPNVPDKENIRIDISISDAYTKSTYSSSIRITASAPKLNISEILPSSITDPGDVVPLTYIVTNNGTAGVSNLKAKLEELSGLNIDVSDPVEIDSILSGNNVNVGFIFTWDPDSAASEISVANFKLILSNDLGFILCDTIDIALGMTDGFETGDFSRNDWVFTGNANWAVDSSVKYEGFYSVRSGLITDNQYSRMSLTYDFTENSSVSFYLKVSSESGYDFLKLFIDDILQDKWSGDADWRKVTYVIPSGIHTIHWQYDKDSSVLTGLDCAWIDNIIISGINPEAKYDLRDSLSESILFGNYPNPFNPVTDIKFYIGNENNVKLQVFNLTGQLVKELVNRRLNAGIHTAKFNAEDLNSGMYFYVLKVGNDKLSRKMLLVK